MRTLVLSAALIFAFGCGEEDIDMEGETTLDCNDDKEMVCDLPVSTVLEDGTTLEVRACTYITYEQCFEKTECAPRG